MAKKISTVLCVVLSVVLALMIWHEKKIENERAAIYKEMSAETRPLSLQVYDLQQQISDLESASSAEQAGTATTQFLVTDLSARSYAAIISPMAEYGYPVGLAVSLSEYPGAEGCLTADEALALAEQGWYFYYAYDADEAAALLSESASTDKAADMSADTLTDEEAAEALSLWLTAVEETASVQEITMSAVVYFPSGSFRDGFAEVLKAQGIQTVIHHGELGAGLLDASEEDGLWYAGSVWWRSNEVLSSKLSSISADGGELVTLMGIDGSATDSLDDWMKRFESVIDGKTIEVTDFSEMAEIQTENASLETGTVEDTQTQIAELEGQIEELEAQIEEIQDKYLEQIRSLGQ